jgi:Predicted membrane protein (DUF2339)
MEIPKQIEALMRKLETLAQHSTDFQNDINNLREEVRLLKNALEKSQQQENPIVEEPKASIEPPIRRNPPISAFGVEPKPKYQQTVPPPKVEIRSEPFAPPIRESILNESASPVSELPSDLEKFIGENLSNKIGILIIVLGISIGVKYAIDHNMITPLMRIILGYLMGGALLGVSRRLYKDYKDLSAAILSGGLAAIYFVTYAAYDFYGLIPQGIAFVVMVVMTISAVTAALYYNLQLIAIGGLIGAYAVPFLLSNNSGRPEILFSYMMIINSGILYIAFKKNWALTTFLAFLFSWLIFLAWISTGYQSNIHFGIACTFATLFFALFYVALLAYPFYQKEVLAIQTLLLLIINALLFYGIGHQLISDQLHGNDFLGFFALINAGVHFGVSRYAYQQNTTDKTLFSVTAALFLLFSTLTIHLQFIGYWVTIGWALEMALLFWIGRTKAFSIYETLSYPVMFLTIWHLIEDMQWGYFRFEAGPSYTSHQDAIMNPYFWTAVIVISFFVFIYKTNQNDSLTSPLEAKGEHRPNFKNVFVTVIVGLLYFLFFGEIVAFFDQKYMNSYNPLSGISVTDNNILNYKTIWLINYTSCFAIVLNYINIKKYKLVSYANVSNFIIILSLFLFLTVGLMTLTDIKNTYQHQWQAAQYPRTLADFMGGLVARYIGLGFVAGLIYSLNENRKQLLNTQQFNILYDLILHSTILWCVSSEMIYWLSFYAYHDTYKLVLSILFGIYALILIILGIRDHKKHLRLAAIGLFGFTLVKLFLYDLAHLGTIQKTIVMISLGILLLIISFLYNKYAKKMLDNDK